MDKALLQVLLKQHNRTKYIEDLTPLQLDVFKQPSKRKLLLWGRRASKTVLLSRLLHYYPNKHPRSVSLYLTTSREHSKRLIWNELINLDKKYKLGLEFNASSLVVTLPNESRIFVSGISNKSDAESHRGYDYSFVAVDEAASFPGYLKYALVEVIEPATKAFDATVILSGTPDRSCASYFCELWNQDNSYLKSHATILDNPKFPLWAGKDNWEKIAKETLEVTRLSDEWKDNPNGFKREYLAEWVRDSDVHAVPFDDDKNIYTELPNSNFTYTAGLDLGTVDPTAMVIGCYSPDEQYLFVEYAFEQSNLSYQSTCRSILDLWSRYSLINIAADPQPGKQIIQDLSNQYGVPIQSAKKRNKEYNMALMASEFRAGRIKVNAKLTTLINQLKELLWNEQQTDVREGSQDHMYSALLYLFNESHHQWGVKKIKPNLTSTELALQKEREHELRMIDRVNKLNQYQRRYGG